MEYNDAGGGAGAQPVTTYTISGAVTKNGQPTGITIEPTLRRSGSGSFEFSTTTGSYGRNGSFPCT